MSYSARSPAPGATSTPDTACRCCSPALGSAPPTAPTSPDGSSRWQPPARCWPAVHRSLLPAAVAMDLTTAADAQQWLDEFTHDIREHADHAFLWPLLIGAWKHKEAR